MITTVLFDLDGTLLDTLDDLTDTMNYILAKNSFSARTRDEIRSFVGDGIKKLVERSVPFSTDSETVDRLFNDFKAHYAVHMKDKTAPYNGITDLLKELKNKNIKIGIVSNKVDEAVRELCGYYFDGLFD
ncbi:MAG: HAD hydrolase-like protein, partial [Clostridia bacterium]|nr:HAD hydrolase-like protein [Clostridia bacterium]